MTSRDAELIRLQTRLATLKSRRRPLEALQDDEFRRLALKAIDQNIAATEREIRKREYVLSGRQK